MNKFIRLEEVRSITGLSRSSIYQFISDGKFPRQIKIGARAVAWDDADIQKWIDKCKGV